MNTYRLVLVVLLVLFGISAAYGVLGYALRAFFLLVGLAVLGLAFTWILGRVSAGLGKLREGRRPEE